MEKIKQYINSKRGDKPKRLNRSAGGDAGIFVFLSLFGIIMVFPMIYAVSQSLKPLDELWRFPPTVFVERPTSKNYTDLFKMLGDSWVPFSRYIFNTVLISVVGTAGNVLLSSLAAYALAKIPFPGRKFFFKTVVYSLMFNSTVTGITNFIIMSRVHMIDTYWAIIIPSWCTTYGLYLMKQFMETSVSDPVLESARLEGASEMRIFWKIAMPMVKPAWVTLIIFAFNSLWNSGSSTYIYSEQLKTFNYAISQVVSAGIARAGASAASTVVTMIVPIIVFIITQSNVIQTMSTSGMKD